MTGTLAVIKPEPEQKCCYCRHIFKCRSRRTTHGKPLSDRNDTINLLVCRIKLGISKDRSTQTLLQLFRPGMVNLVASAKRREWKSGVIDFDEMLTEMQSFAIESIIVKYRIGELNPITNFLFDKRNGYLIKWSRWYITKHKRFNARHTLAGGNPFADGYNDGDEYVFVDSGHGSEYNHIGSDAYGRSVGEAASGYLMEQALDTHYANERHSLTDEVNEIIENGLTLNANEYRALRFCMNNANDSNDIRMIDGLHIHLARMMGVSRPRVTRLYKRGKDKLTVAIKKRRYETEEKEARNEAN